MNLHQSTCTTNTLYKIQLTFVLCDLTLKYQVFLIIFLFKNVKINFKLFFLASNLAKQYYKFEIYCEKKRL